METSTRQGGPSGGRASRGRAPGLAGVTGRLGVQVEGRSAGVLRVDDGETEFVPGAAATDAQAVVSFASREVVDSMLSGRLNPVVGVLQGKLELSGDVSFAVEVILGLRAGSPFGDEGTRGGT